MHKMPLNAFNCKNGEQKSSYCKYSFRLNTKERRYTNDVNTFYSMRYENNVFDMMIRFNALC